MKEEDIEYTIVERNEVPDEVFADIAKGVEGEEGMPPFTKDDLISLSIKVVGEEEPITIIGFKQMLLEEANSDMAIRMVISQTLENRYERKGNNDGGDESEVEGTGGVGESTSD